MLAVQSALLGFRTLLSVIFAETIYLVEDLIVDSKTTFSRHQAHRSHHFALWNA